MNLINLRYQMHFVELNKILQVPASDVLAHPEQKDTYTFKGEAGHYLINAPINCDVLMTIEKATRTGWKTIAEGSVNIFTMTWTANLATAQFTKNP